MHTLKSRMRRLRAGVDMVVVLALVTLESYDFSHPRMLDMLPTPYPLEDEALREKYLV